MSSLRIAIVTNRFAPHIGGIERQMGLIGRGLARRGHQVTVLTRRYDPALPRRERMDGLAVERFGPSGQGVVSKWLVNLATFWRLVTSTPPFDCALVTQFSATVIGPALTHAVGRGVPMVLRPAEPGEFTGDVSRGSLSRLPFGTRHLVRTALRRTRGLAYRQVKVIVAIAELLAQEAERFGFPPDSIVRIPNPLDTTLFRPATPAEREDVRAALGIPGGAMVVTFSGRLARGKGVLTLARAWKELAPRHPEALLVIVGSGPGPHSPLDEEQALRRFLRAERLEQRVLLLGARPDVQRYLAASDVFVFPSEAGEGFGNALAEAMACGVPVVASQIECGAADLMVEGEHGFKFEAGNPASLCGRLHQLLLDEPARARMGAAGRRLAEQRLGLDAAVEGYEHALRLAIERR
ncbi:MAG TPA: glycosyltransferase family 4 protein [Gemmatimonadales bacterium]|nr:glycosyltransferase family 4 protein [Gemmatimonadales bacterium]